jgi:hypothetical protein
MKDNSNNLSSNVHDVEFVDSYAHNKNKSAYIVHIKVLEDDEWIGDFFADFVEGALRMGDENETVYVADWDSVKKGNGLYVDQEPPFWPVEDAAQTLNSGQFDEIAKNHSFKSINSGPRDI